MDSSETTAASRAEVEPLPANVRSVQPGGGVCCSIELAWGHVRRAILKRVRPIYVRRMAALRRGDPTGAPHELLDPRDLKFCRNQCTAHWAPEDDRFAWRDRLPFARWGLAELVLMGVPLTLLTIGLALSPYWYLAIAVGVVLGWVISFFRDPSRVVPVGPGLVVAPADGTIAEITRLDHDPFIGGPAVRIGIFLSIFNVHLNRSPIDARVARLRYHPGKFLNALNPESAILNENMVIGLEETTAPYRKLVVRQIAGLFARKIVCDLKPGQEVRRGERFGMIKLGSRTEIILPDEAGLEITVKVGDKVQAGSTLFAKLPKSS
ncbi:MAG: phosphatidylserine decarboxylase family protein [Planctomycetia bacterium]|nr:phosphatidylserine decarboxylase family protein [Planctomycetia bacterium]